MKKLVRWSKRLCVIPDLDEYATDFWSICPCHRDTHPTLHVYVGTDGRIKMKCLVCGATGFDVCRKLDIEETELEADHVGFDADARMDWEMAVTCGAMAVLDKVYELNTRLDTASEDLISSLVECFADRVAREVDMLIDKEIADTTPPMEKTARACGFEDDAKEELSE